MKNQILILIALTQIFGVPIYIFYPSYIAAPSICIASVILIFIYRMRYVNWRWSLSRMRRVDGVESRWWSIALAPTALGLYNVGNTTIHSHSNNIYLYLSIALFCIFAIWSLSEFIKRMTL